MIPYGQDITENDIRNYWGNGYVLLRQGGVWSMYRLIAVDGDRFLLNKSNTVGMADKNAPKEVTLTRDQFFEQVLLHRPELGIVPSADSASLIQLGWVPAHGNQIKALTSNDIHITTLCKRKPKVAVVHEEPPIQEDQHVNLPLMLVRKALAGNQVTIRIGKSAIEASKFFQSPLRRDNMPRVAGRDEHKGRLKLVVSYLNSTALEFQDAYVTSRDRHFSPLQRDWWLRGNAAGAVLYAGQTALGTVILHNPAEAEFKVVKGVSKEQSTVLKAMAKAILAGYAINTVEKIEEKAHAIAKES